MSTCVGGTLGKRRSLLWKIAGHAHKSSTCIRPRSDHHLPFATHWLDHSPVVDTWLMCLWVHIDDTWYWYLCWFWLILLWCWCLCWCWSFIYIIWVSTLFHWSSLLGESRQHLGPLCFLQCFKLNLISFEAILTTPVICCWRKDLLYFSVLEVLK